MTQELKSKLLSFFKFIFATALFIFVIFTLYRELSHINFKETFIQFGKINRLWLVLLFAGGGTVTHLIITVRYYFSKGS